MADFISAVKKLGKSVVGIGFRKDPEYKIIGTGTIIHPEGWILTNRHVLEPLLDNDLNRIRPDAAIFLFLDHPQSKISTISAGIGISNISDISFPPPKGLNQSRTNNVSHLTFHDIDPRQVIDPEEPDIGICKININQLPEFIFPLKVAKIKDSKIIKVGEEVGVLGFPGGLHVPEKFASPSQIQITPLFQTGNISGILPFSMDDNATSYVLDMLINPGSSGSPVFNKNGDVIGIVYATRLSFEPLQEISKNKNKIHHNDFGVNIPTGLGLAIPSSRLPKEWLSDDVE